MSTNEEDARSLIADLVKQERGADAVPMLIRPTSVLYISSSQNVDVSPFDVVISCTPEPLPERCRKDMKGKGYLHLKCQMGKLGSRDLRNKLAQLRTFFASRSPSGGKMLVCCPTGKDLAVGTALAILCWYADEDGTVDIERKKEGREIDKSFIKQRLSWITTSNPALNPSRATLQSVNSVILSSQDPKANFSTPFPIRSLANTIPSNPLPTEQKKAKRNDTDIPTRIFHHLSSHP